MSMQNNKEGGDTLSPSVKMKSSGVEWIGDIPESWSVERMKYVCDISTGSKNTEDSVDDGKYPFYVRSPTVHHSNTYSYDGEAVLTAGDGDVGKIFHYVNGKYECHQRVYNLTNIRHIPAKFLYYYLTANFSKEVDKGTAKSTVSSLRLPMLCNFPVCIPDNSTEVSSYLDQICDKMDEIISSVHIEIDSLQDYKKSVIYEVVTKGLDPNAKMKDSGIEWVEKIPEHWTTCTVKSLFRINKRISGVIGPDVLSVTQSGLKIKDLNSNEGQLSMDYSKYQIVEVGDFVMNHMDLLTGFIDCSKYMGVTSPDYRVFTPISEKVNSGYYLDIFKMCYWNKIFYGFGQGVSTKGRWRLQSDAFLNFILPVPPLEEQSKISERINQITAFVDKVIEQKSQSIVVLESYKNSLIYEYVTGKKQVPTEVKS